MDNQHHKRTTEQLQHHLRRCNSCKNTISFCFRQPAINNLEVIKTFFHCNSYFCETCALRKKRKLQKRLKRLKINGRLRFLTLTLSTVDFTPEQALNNISSFFNDFCHRLRDRGYKFQFFKIIELSKKDQAHLHVLINCFIPRITVLMLWKSITGSYIVDIRAVNSHEKAVEYLTKYMTKSISAISNYLFFIMRKRRFSCSQNFFSEILKELKFSKSFIHFFDEKIFLELLNKFIHRRFFNSKLMTVNILNHNQDYLLNFSKT